MVLASSDLRPLANESAKEIGLDTGRIYALPGMDGKITQTGSCYETLVSTQIYKQEPVRGADLDKSACESIYAKSVAIY